MPRQTRGGRAPSKRRGGPRTGPDAARGRAGPRAPSRNPAGGGPGPGEAAADGGTGGPARRGGTRETTPDRGGPTPRGIEADPAEGGRRGAGGPGPTPERTGRAARWNAGDDPGPGRADAAWHRGDPAERGPGNAGGPAATPRTPPGTGGAGGGAAKPTRGPRSGDHRSARGRRTPPTDSWGARRPREGRMPDPFGPGWALGADRPPAGRMTRAGRSGPSPAPGAVAGRPAAGGLSSGTVAHLRRGCGNPPGRCATGGERRSASAVFSDPARHPRRDRRRFADRHGRHHRGAQPAKASATASRTRAASPGATSSRRRTSAAISGNPPPAPVQPTCTGSPIGGVRHHRGRRPARALADPGRTWPRSPAPCARGENNLHLLTIGVL